MAAAASPAEGTNALLGPNPAPATVTLARAVPHAFVEFDPERDDRQEVDLVVSQAAIEQFFGFPGVAVVCARDSTILGVAVARLVKRLGEDHSVSKFLEWNGAVVSDDHESADKARRSLQSLINELAERKVNDGIVHVHDRDLLESVSKALDDGLSPQRLVVAVHLDEVAVRDDSRFWRVAEFAPRLQIAYAQWLRQESDGSETPPPPPADLLARIESAPHAQDLKSREDELTEWLEQGYDRVAHAILLETDPGGRKVIAAPPTLKEQPLAPMFRAIHFLMGECARPTPGVFERLLLVLLRDKELIFEDEETVVRDGETTKRKVQREASALEHWQRSSDDCLLECGIEEVRRRGSNLPAVYAYVSSTDGFSISQYLRRRLSNFRRNAARELLESGLLFDPEVDPETVECLVKLARRMASDYPRDFGFELLKKMLQGIEMHLSLLEESGRRDIASRPPSRIEDVYNLLASVERLLHRKHQHTYVFYRRLAELCGVLLTDDATKPAVEGLLKELHRGNAASVPVLWRLARQLRGRDGFAYEDEVVHMLSCAAPDDRRQIFDQVVSDALHAQSEKDLLRRNRTIELIERRRPKVSADSTEPNAEGLYWLAFLWRVTQLGRTEGLEPALYGLLFGTEGPIRKALPDWLLHPHLAAGVALLLRECGDAQIASRGISPASVIADLLEVWFGDQQASDAECRAGFELVFRATARRMAPALRRQVVAIYGVRVAVVQRQMGGVPIADSPKRRELKTRRTRLLELQIRLRDENQHYSANSSHG